MDDQDWRKEGNDGWEVDCFSRRARRIVRFPRGGWKRVKSKFNRRQRHKSKQELKKGLTED